jgi:hypothetical protein
LLNVNVPVDAERVIDPGPDNAPTVKLTLASVRFRFPFSASGPALTGDPPVFTIVAPLAETVVLAMFSV